MATSSLPNINSYNDKYLRYRGETISSTMAIIFTPSCFGNPKSGTVSGDVVEIGVSGRQADPNNPFTFSNNGVFINLKSGESFAYSGRAISITAKFNW